MTRERVLRRDLVSESVIYGLILVSALLIVVGRGEQSSWDTFLKASGTVVDSGSRTCSPTLWRG